MTRVNAERTLALYQSGLSLRKTGKKLGVSHSTARNIIKRLAPNSMRPSSLPRLQLKPSPPCRNGHDPCFRFPANGDCVDCVRDRVKKRKGKASRK